MRNLFVLICCISFCNFIYGQTKTKEYYFKKNQNQKRTAWILLGTGTAAVVTGAVIESKRERGDQSFKGGIIELGGIICALTSIPIFISSSINKKRATRLSVSNQKVLQLHENVVAWKSQPTLSFKISLNN